MVQSKRLMTIALFTAIAFCGTSYCAKSADAQHWRPVDKVQVQYCFYDYGHYYWSTVLETYDHNEAFWACCFLLVDKVEGTLNEKVPHANPKCWNSALESKSPAENGRHKD